MFKYVLFLAVYISSFFNIINAGYYIERTNVDISENAANSVIDAVFDNENCLHLFFNEKVEVDYGHPTPIWGTHIHAFSDGNVWNTERMPFKFNSIQIKVDRNGTPILGSSSAPQFYSAPNQSPYVFDNKNGDWELHPIMKWGENSCYTKVYDIGIDFDQKNNLHVTWVSIRENSDDSWTLKLMHGVCENDVWREEVIADLGVSYKSNSELNSFFKILSNGDCAVAYTDNNGKFVLAKNAGRGWKITSSIDLPDSGPIQFLIDDLGAAHVVFASFVTSGPFNIHEGIRYTTNASGKWTSELIEKCIYFPYDKLYAITTFDLPHIEIDAQKKIHITYRVINVKIEGTSIYGFRQEQQELKYAAKNNGKWQICKLTESPFFYNNMVPEGILRYWNSYSLAVDKLGIPHIFYREINSGLIEMVKVFM